jgi:TonB-dependent receptor
MTLDTSGRRSLHASVSAGAMIMALLGFGASAYAQAAPATPAAEVDAVVVTGYRQSLESAVNTKRATVEISDSISSDGLGRFPDLNVGEAIQRIPGVQINREADSRNATISLRGLPGTFARTTLNGVAFADPILSTATNTASTPLGAFNSDVFTSITVIKSPDAADLAGGLSGNVDLRIAPALSRKDGGFVKFSEEYNTLGKLASPEATIGFNHHFGSDFAVFGTVAYKKENFRRDSISVNSWATKLGSIQVGNQGAAGANPVYDALALRFPGGVFYPNQVRQFSRRNVGHLLTTATGVEWKPTDQLKLGVTGFYTERNLDQGTNDLLYDDTNAGNATNTALNATSKVVHFLTLGTPYVVNTPSGPKAYINSFTAENVQTFDSTRSEPAKQQTWAVNPSIEFKNDTWRLAGIGTVSRAEVLANQIELDIQESPGTNRILAPNGVQGNGITTSLYTGGTDLSGLQETLNTPNAIHIDPNGYPVGSAANQATQAGDAAGNKYGVTGTNGQSKNELDAVQVDAERYFADGHFLSGLQVGGRFEHDKFVSIGSRNTSLGTLAGAINGSMVSPEPALSDFFGGQAGGHSPNWVRSNIAQVLAAITPINPAALPAQFALNPATGVFLTPYNLINNYWDPNFFQNNFTNANDITSVYAMAKFNSSILSIPVRGNFGVRYEHTRNTLTSLDCVNCGSALATTPAPVIHSLTTRTYKQDYHYVLPSFLAAADLTDKLVLRFAAYSTYVRPQPRDNVPTTAVTVPEPAGTTPAVFFTSPTYVVVAGAPTLKPYRSDSFDVSLEWYNRHGGLISVDAFQKNVKGYIGPITDTNVLCPASGLVNGVNVGLGTLTRVGATCVSSNTFPDSSGHQVAALVNISGQTNLLPLTVRGVEFDVEQNLDFLPGFWKNFGGGFNLSYTQVSGKDSAGNKITLPSVSKYNANLIGYYETPLFGVRLVYNYRGKYPLAAGNTFVGDAREVKARSQLDASATLNINKTVSISVDAFNLTDATRSEYENDPRLPRRIDYDGRTFDLTVRANF